MIETKAAGIARGIFAEKFLSDGVKLAAMAHVQITFSKQTLELFRDTVVPNKPGPKRNTTLYNKLFRCVDDEGENGFFKLLEMVDDINWTPYEEYPLIFSPLIYKDISRVRALISHGYDVNAEDYDGTSILQSFRVSLDVFKEIIWAGGNVKRKQLILDHASYCFSSFSRERVRILIENGADVQHLYNSIYLPSHEDNESKLKIVKHLLNNGFSVDPNKVQFRDAYRRSKASQSKDRLMTIISDFETRSALGREAISAAISVDSDLAFIISKALYEYTPYNSCFWL